MNWWPDGDNHPDRIALSALEHYTYCPRQAALIHIDGIFTDDVNTVRGHLAHDRVDRPGIRATASVGMRQHYAVPVWSANLGVYGRCDVIETNDTVAVPVEHKIGAYRPGGPADVQVAAQAMCLREMLDIDVPHGEVFTHADRRRHRVELTRELTAAVRVAIAGMRSVLTDTGLPAAAADARCRHCSLIDDCLPHELLKPAQEPYRARPLGAWHE